MVRKDSSSITFDRVQIDFFLFFVFCFCFCFGASLLAEPQTDEGGAETGVPEKPPDDALQKMPHTKARKFKLQSRLEPKLQHWWQARQANRLTITPRAAPLIRRRENEGKSLSSERTSPLSAASIQGQGDISQNNFDGSGRMVPGSQGTAQPRGRVTRRSIDAVTQSALLRRG